MFDSPYIFRDITTFPTVAATIIVILLFVVVTRFWPALRRKTSWFAGSIAVYFLLWAALVFDAYASVWHFNRLCRTEAGFHGEPFPKGAGVILPLPNLLGGCDNLVCKELLQDGLVAFVEGSHKVRVWEQEESDPGTPGFHTQKWRYWPTPVGEAPCRYPKRFEFITPSPDDAHHRTQYCIAEKKIGEYSAPLILERSHVFLPYPIGNISRLEYTLINPKQNEEHAKASRFRLFSGWLEHALDESWFQVRPAAGECHGTGLYFSSRNIFELAS